MRKESEFEISLNIPPDKFVKIISDNSTTRGIVVYPAKHIFKGEISGSAFRLFRLKQFSWSDYNATEFSGKFTMTAQRPG